MTTNYSKNLWYILSLFLLLFFTSFLANSNETTLNAYETTTSATTSTESDVNTYDVNNSDVNISETLALNSLTSSVDVESTRKWVFLVSWSPGPSLKNSEWKHWFHPLFLHFFSSIFFKDNMCFKTNTHCVWQMSS